LKIVGDTSPKIKSNSLWNKGSIGSRFWKKVSFY